MRAVFRSINQILSMEKQVAASRRNKAEDVNGPINPLGAFLQRDAEAIEKAKANDAAARLEIGPNERDGGHDSESERAPRLSPSDAKRQLEPAPIPKPPKRAGTK